MKEMQEVLNEMFDYLCDRYKVKATDKRLCTYFQKIKNMYKKTGATILEDDLK